MSFKDPFTKLVRSPALLAVLILEFVLLFFVGLLFSIASYAVPPTPTLSVVIGSSALLLVQALLFVLIDACFKAGFATMLRNTIQDGSTTIREFFPGVRRYAIRFFGFFLVRSFLVVLLGIPVLLAFFFQTGGLLRMFATIVFLIGSLLVSFYFFLWVGPCIVFEDLGLADALQDSFRRTLEKPLRTFLVLLACILFILVGGLLVAGLGALLTPFLFAETASTIWIAVLFDIVAYCVFTVSIVLASLYVYAAYEPTKARSRATRRGRARKKQRAR